MSDYELYHDESLEGAGYWHGMLLVPVNKKDQLLKYLNSARKNTGYSDPIGIKKVKKRNRVYRLGEAWIQIAIGFLRSSSRQKAYPISLGKMKKGQLQYDYLPDGCVGAKFILFRECDSHQKMAFYTDHASKVETTYRMGLKGGMHFLGNSASTIHIGRMHFDGYEHHQRHIDRDRIVGRLYGLREYCSISNRPDLIDDRSSDHRKTEECQPYADCQLLQLTDLLVSGFRTVLGSATRDIHLDLTMPLRQIVERHKEGYQRMQNSRWCDSFSFSQCFLEEGHWHFQSIEDIEIDENVQQLGLFCQDDIC